MQVVWVTQNICIPRKKKVLGWDQIPTYFHIFIPSTCLLDNEIGCETSENGEYLSTWQSRLWSTVPTGVVRVNKCSHKNLFQIYEGPPCPRDIMNKLKPQSWCLSSGCSTGLTILSKYLHRVTVDHKLSCIYSNRQEDEIVQWTNLHLKISKNTVPIPNPSFSDILYRFDITWHKGKWMKNSETWKVI